MGTPSPPRGLYSAVWVALPGCKESQAALACLVPTSLLSQEAQTQILHSVHRPRLSVHSHAKAVPQSLHHAAFYSSCPAVLNGLELCFESDHLAGRAVHTSRFPAQPCLCFPLSKVSMWHTHCSSEPLPGSLHTPPPPKAKSLSQSGLATACQ